MNTLLRIFIHNSLFLFSVIFFPHPVFAQTRASDSLKSAGGKMQARHPGDEKEKENKLVAAERELKDFKLKRQELDLIYGSIGLVVLITLLGYMYYQYRERKKSYVHLEKKNADIKSCKLLIEKTLADLKSIQAQLIQSDKMASIGVLTAGIAHELSNPINFISAGVEGLSEVTLQIKSVYAAYDNLTQGNVSEKLDEIQAMKTQLRFHEMQHDQNQLIETVTIGARRAEAIVKTLQRFSHKTDDEPIETRLEKIIDETLVLVHGEVKNRVIVKKHVEDALPAILVKPAEIGQVLLNILINACHSIEDKGEIVIHARHITNTIEISIRDTGAGIAPHHIARIFDPFFTTKQVGKGTGLGLTISYNIIRSYGGNIHVASTPEKGTEFTIVLPAFEQTF